MPPGLARALVIEDWYESDSMRDGTMELKRAPGTCCPDPECDRVIAPKECSSCGISCVGCPAKPLHVLTNRRYLSIELPDAEFEKLVAGETIAKVFHPLWLSSKKLLVLIGKHLPKSADPMMQNKMKEGWHIAPWPMTDATLVQIESGDKVPCMKYEGFQIAIVLERRMPRVAG